MAMDVEHWRDTQRSVRFFVLDGRVVVMVLLWLLHVAWWTFFLMIGAIAFFAFLERRGLRFDAALRAIRAFFAGVNRPAMPPAFKRRLMDYGGK